MAIPEDPFARDIPGRPLTPEDFDALFNTFQRTVTRLETLPAYAVGGAEAERLAAFHAGQPRPLRTVVTDPWLARIAHTSPGQGGKRWSRVRVVDQPLTDYQRYQLASYRESQACGEEVTIVPRSKVGDVRDFWLFDERTPFAFAVLMHYSPDGQWLGADRIDDADLLADLTAELDAASRFAVPLNSFLTVVDA